MPLFCIFTVSICTVLFILCTLGSVCGHDYIERLYTMMNVISRTELVYIYWALYWDSKEAAGFNTVLVVAAQVSVNWAFSGQLPETANVSQEQSLLFCL